MVVVRDTARRQHAVEDQILPTVLILTDRGWTGAPTHCHSHRTAGPWEAIGAPWDMTIPSPEPNLNCRASSGQKPLTVSGFLSVTAPNERQSWTERLQLMPCAHTGHHRHCTANQARTPPLQEAVLAAWLCRALWPKKGIPRERLLSKQFLGPGLRHSHTPQKLKVQKPSRH